MLLKTYRRVILLKLLSLVIGALLLARYGRTTYSTTNATSTASSTVILIDLSTSMNTIDMPGSLSRLDYAKKLITKYVLENKSSVGLIAFTTDTVSYIVPPTEDTEVFLEKLSLLHTRSLDSLSSLEENKGNKYTSAVAYALQDTGSMHNYILLSDFNSTATNATLDALDTSTHKTNTFTIIALGTTQPQSMTDADGKTLSAQAVGRNDGLGETLATNLHSDYTISPELLSSNQTAPRSEKASPQRVLWLATLLLLLSL